MCWQWGIDDPEAWLDAQDERKLATWQGYFEVEPQCSEWERHAEQMAILDRILAVGVNTNLAKDAKPYEARQQADFLPDGWRDTPETQPQGDAGIDVMKSLADEGTRVVYGDND